MILSKSTANIPDFTLHQWFSVHLKTLARGECSPCLPPKPPLKRPRALPKTYTHPHPPSHGKSDFNVTWYSTRRTHASSCASFLANSIHSRLFSRGDSAQSLLPLPTEFCIPECNSASFASQSALAHTSDIHWCNSAVERSMSFS